MRNRGREGFVLLQLMLVSSVIMLLVSLSGEWLQFIKKQHTGIETKSSAQLQLQIMARLASRVSVCTRSLKGLPMPSLLSVSTPFTLRHEDGSVLAVPSMHVANDYYVEKVELSSVTSVSGVFYLGNLTIGLLKSGPIATRINEIVPIELVEKNGVLDFCGSVDANVAHDIRLGFRTGPTGPEVFLRTPGSLPNLRIGGRAYMGLGVGDPDPSSNDGIKVDFSLDCNGSDWTGPSMGMNYVYAIPANEMIFSLCVAPQSPRTIAGFLTAKDFLYIGPLHVFNNIGGIAPFVSPAPGKVKYIGDFSYLMISNTMITIDPVKPFLQTLNLSYLVPEYAEEAYFQTTLVNEACAPGACKPSVSGLYIFMPSEFTGLLWALGSEAIQQNEVNAPLSPAGDFVPRIRRFVGTPANAASSTGLTDGIVENLIAPGQPGSSIKIPLVVVKGFGYRT